MITPLSRPLETDNPYLRMMGDLSVGQSAVNRASRETPTMGRMFSAMMAQGEAANVAEMPVRTAQLVQEEAYKAEAAQLAYEMQGASADELPAIRDRLKALEDQHNVPLDSTTQQQLAMGRIQQPAVLAEKYPDVKFDRPMSEDEAKLLYDTRKADLIRQAIIQQGPTGFVSGVQKFGNSLIAMATDPLEVATSFIPVFGEAGKAWAIARFGGLGGKVLLGAAEGGIGNALTEPAYAALSRSQQQDYTMADSLMNVGLGFVLGGGLGAISHVAARGAKEAPTARAEVSAPDVAARVDMPVAEAPVARAEAVKPDTPHLTEQYRVRKETMRLADEQRPAAETALRQFSTGQTVDVAPVMPRQSVADLPASRINGASMELKLATKADAASPKPLMAWLKRGQPLSEQSIAKAQREGRQPRAYLAANDLRIDPSGTLGKELKAQDITPQTAPGIWRKGGRDTLDNVVASEMEDSFPGIIDATGSSREPGAYLDRDGLTALLIRDATGDKSWLRSHQDVMRAEADLAYEQRNPEVALAKHAAFDPLADDDYSRAVSEYEPTKAEEEIADLERMVAQMSEEDAFEMAGALAAITQRQEKAKAMADAFTAAITCMARQ